VPRRKAALTFISLFFNFTAFKLHSSLQRKYIYRGIQRQFRGAFVIQEHQSPLHVAARLGNVDNVMLLLQHGASPDCATYDLYTPLHIAAKEGHDEVAQALLDQGANLNLLTLVRRVFEWNESIRFVEKCKAFLSHRHPHVDKSFHLFMYLLLVLLTDTFDVKQINKALLSIY
jgi:hypothetical protein